MIDGGDSLVIILPPVDSIKDQGSMIDLLLY